MGEKLRGGFVMNKNCNNKECIYYETCLIDNYNRDKKCTGKLSIKNPKHPNFEATTRGGNK